jgi:hypothetical protein
VGGWPLFSYGWLFYFSLSEHLISAMYALPFALLFMVFAVFGFNSARYSRAAGMVEDRKDVAMLLVFAALSAGMAYAFQHSVFFYTFAGCLAVLALARPAPKSLASLVTLCTAGLLLAFSFGGKKPGRRGEHVISRKLLRGECRVIPV